MIKLGRIRRRSMENAEGYQIKGICGRTLVLFIDYT
jgi:hypothetical protein